ncbi:hypothetical protein [Azorhizobium doebereinerae]|uniref:hypothetical protein n=1 Tax=Azorhizobium doebereinerae TaxID=281091 RepID=UPI0003F94511|nr:hypothetical protein [Azorhizobium doebereinerae]
MAEIEQTPSDFAAAILARQGVTIRPEEAQGLAALARQLNAAVAAGAQARVTIDASPWSFPTLRAEIAERGEAEA